MHAAIGGRRRRAPPSQAADDQAADDQAADDQAAGEQAVEPLEARRLEQHFVYNSLNTIASLIRTDPGRARELLFGFADLCRAADRPTATPSTLAHELDAVRGYLALEQARFGRRLRVELDVGAGAAGRPGRARCACSPSCATPCSVTSSPAPEGGVLAVTARPDRRRVRRHRDGRCRAAPRARP